MNKRIEELAQQSKLAELYDRYVEQCMKNADDDILDYDVIVKEFAELIVKECMDIAYAYDAPKMSGPGMIVANRIEDHFGVEE